MKDLETFTAPKESSRTCTAHDDLSGRWVSKNHFAPPTLEPGSPFFDWIQTQVSSHPFSLYPPCRGRPSIAATDECSRLSQFNPSSPPTIKGFPPVRLPDYRSFDYVYTPYSCKIPHRSTFEWLDEVKPDTVLVIGDAITRDFFCLNWGFEDQDVCRYSTNWDYRDKSVLPYLFVETSRACRIVKADCSPFATSPATNISLTFVPTKEPQISTFIGIQSRIQMESLVTSTLSHLLQLTSSSLLIYGSLDVIRLPNTMSSQCDLS